MTKKQLKKLIKHLPSNASLIIERDGIMYGIQDISYCEDSDGNNYIIIKEKVVQK